MQTESQKLFPARTRLASRRPSERFTFAERVVFTRASFTPANGGNQTDMTNQTVAKFTRTELEEEVPAAQARIEAAVRDMANDPHNEKVPRDELLSRATKLEFKRNPRLAQAWVEAPGTDRVQQS